VQLWVEPLKDKEGNLVGPHAISTKYGTPKCEFSSRLVRVDETNLHPSYTPTWVGGHPSLGEQIAKALIDRHASTPIPDWPRAISSVQSQVRLDSRSRVDFVVHHPQCKPRLVEVKTVVDTDYCVSWPLPQRAKCVFTSSFHPYRRCALFPWGSSNQKGPDGQAVVSARAIKHVHELTKLHERLEYDATILFIVIRGDAQVFAPNAQACPTFSRYLQQAQEAGVQILAKRVQWDHLGQCWDDEWLPVEFPQDLETQE
jgi:DNA-binding sugar fermentation-stimulating protein